MNKPTRPEMTLAGFGAGMALSGCGNPAQVGCVTVTTGAGAIALEVRTSSLEGRALGLLWIAAPEVAELGAVPLELVPLEAALLEV